jgi:hypothetical protein
MSEFDSPSYVEYVYEKRAEGKALLLKYSLLLGYAVFVASFFGICYVTRLVPVFAVCPLVTWILIHFTWQYVSYDVYYTFEHGHFVFGKIKRGRSGKMRSAIIELDVQRAILVASYQQVVKSREYNNANRVYNLASTLSSENLLGIVYERDGKVNVVIFENTPKLARLLPKYSSVTSDVAYR